MKQQKERKTSDYAVGLGIVFGSAIGATFAVLTGGNIALGAGYGIALGIILGSVIVLLGKKKQ